MAGGYVRFLIFAAAFCCRKSAHAAIMSFVLLPSAFEVRRAVPTTVRAGIFRIVNGMSSIRVMSTAEELNSAMQRRIRISTFFSSSG